MKLHIKKLLLIVILAGIAVGITYLVKPGQFGPSAPEQEEQAVFPVSRELQGKSIVMQDYVRYYGENGENALELLQKTTSAEIKQFDFGAFVESINGIKPDEKHFWKLYYNGAEAQVGADQLETKSGDVIEWFLEGIEGEQK